jgi:hypothetical protein
MEVVKDLKASNDATQATRQARERTAQRWLGFAYVEIPALLLVLTGWWMLRRGLKQGQTLSRYRFEHTNPHGVVEFADYDGAVLFNKQIYWAEQKVKFGAAVLVIGLIGAALGIPELTSP